MALAEGLDVDATLLGQDVERALGRITDDRPVRDVGVVAQGAGEHHVVEIGLGVTRRALDLARRSRTPRR